jgi:hypothetical protein
MIVSVKDAVELGYCIKGIKEFCKKHNIDFRDFVNHGVDADVLLDTDDAMALKVVEHKKAQIGEIDGR